LRCTCYFFHCVQFKSCDIDTVMPRVSAFS
jgi:hypothetical protein